jgi:hypothetical protein
MTPGPSIAREFPVKPWDRSGHWESCPSDASPAPTAATYSNDGLSSGVREDREARFQVDALQLIRFRGGVAFDSNPSWIDPALSSPARGSEPDLSSGLLPRELEPGGSRIVHPGASSRVRHQARQHALGLAARYEALRDAGAACHDSERSYYVDPSTMAMIGKIREVLTSDPVDRGSVQKLVQGVGMESCHKCHMVHGPAALARYIGGTEK